MKQSLKFTLLTTSALFICLVFVWFYVAAKADGKVAEVPLRSAFFGEPTEHGGPVPQTPWPAQESIFWVAYQGLSIDFPENSLPAFKAAADLGPQVILWADIQYTNDRQLVAFADKDLMRTTGQTGWMQQISLNEARALNIAKNFNSGAQQPQQISTLSELLAALPNHRFILNFKDHTAGLDAEIVRVLNEARAVSRVIIQSEHDGLLRDVRALMPVALYGTSPAQMTQLLMLIPLKLSGLAGLKGDVYFSPYSRRGEVLIDDDVMAEMKKRGRRVFVGPVESVEQVHDSLKRGAVGIVARNPQAYFHLSAH